MATQAGDIVMFTNTTVAEALTAICLGASCLGATIDGAAAGGFTRGCAARDLQVLMLIEQHESTDAVSAERLSDAMLTMMHARMVCHEGNVADALALYDSVSRSITPNPRMSDRRY
jgi:hypothetical protein